jgi:hypothetical protein
VIVHLPWQSELPFLHDSSDLFLAQNIIARASFQKRRPLSLEQRTQNIAATAPSPSVKTKTNNGEKALPWKGARSPLKVMKNAYDVLIIFKFFSLMFFNKLGKNC